MKKQTKFHKVLVSMFGSRLSLKNTFQMDVEHLNEQTENVPVMAQNVLNGNHSAQAGFSPTDRTESCW